MLAQSLRGDFCLDLFALLRVMSEFPKFLICFFCAGVFMGYLYIEIYIDLLVMEQQFILLWVIEMTLHTRQS